MAQEIKLVNPTFVQHGDFLHFASEPCYQCGTMKIRNRLVVCDEVDRPHTFAICSTSPHHKNARNVHIWKPTAPEGKPDGAL